METKKHHKEEKHSKVHSEHGKKMKSEKNLIGKKSNKGK